MGYSTSFKGKLSFTRDLKGSELAILGKILFADCRDHEDWPKPYKYGLDYMVLKLTTDMDGLEWDESEKTSPMQHLVNVLIEVMKRDVPDFELIGEMVCQGEDMDDRWTLVMKDNVAVRVEHPRVGAAVICPHCEGKVYIDEAEPAE